MFKSRESKLIGKVVDVQKVIDRGGGEKLLAFLSLYPKYKSFAALAYVGLTIPKAMIITSAEVSAKKECNKILANWRVDETSVRTDRKGGGVFGISAQGCKVSDVWTVACAFLQKGLLPMVISAGDIFHNTYSANIVVDPLNHKSFYLEIVGPGFCATDISKRDVVNERGFLRGSKEGCSFYDRKIVSQKNYNEQVDVLKQSLIQKKERRTGETFQNSDKANEWVNKYLAEKGALILNHLNYNPIPSSYLQKIWDYLPQIARAGRKLGYTDEKFVVSMSFVKEKNEEKPYFWDIHPYFGYKSKVTV